MLIGRTIFKENIYYVYVDYKIDFVEIIIADDERFQNIVSAYKKRGVSELVFGSRIAREVLWNVKNCIGQKKGKKYSQPDRRFGVVVTHTGKIGKNEYEVSLAGNALVALKYTGENFLELTYVESVLKHNLEYTENKDTENDLQVNNLEDIKLIKDLSWLKKKKYYIINDDAQAEIIFKKLENYRGPISLDFETTGLNINVFGKINSAESKLITDENRHLYKADTVVGAVISIEEDTAYYFPFKQRKYKNLYEDRSSKFRNSIIRKARNLRLAEDPDSDMARYYMKYADDEISCDVVGMERLRQILETKHIVAHNGEFEWRCCWLYEIALNLKDDTMLLHQVMYKYRDPKNRRGEPSGLKYLTYKEFSIETLDLTDFFDRDIFRTGKAKNEFMGIDFSYMGYEETRAYAPADSDFTLYLYKKYKYDLKKNMPELEYIYNVEVIVAQAIGYAQFYGLRIDENKIKIIQNKLEIEAAELEKELRKLGGLSEEDEFKFSSPKQVAELFYDKLGMPFKGKKSVSKATLKPLMDLKDENGKDKYPIIKKYSTWKKTDTLATKFITKLPEFMWPGGIIFPSFGQIDTATGRMNSSKPNSQQFAKQIVAIVCPRAGFVMLDSDLSQIEYRLMVSLAGEKHLITRMCDPDMDFHTLMASIMYGISYSKVTEEKRKDAKGYNFGIPYGMGFKSLALITIGRCGPEDIEEAKRKHALYFKDQQKVKAFFEYVKESALINGYTKTYWGRRRYYDFGTGGAVNNFKKAAALRQAGNAVIQGTAADIFKIGIARCFLTIKKAKLIGKMLMNNFIHDEILFEVDYRKVDVRKALQIVVRSMEINVNDSNFTKIYVGAGFGTSWSRAKSKDNEIHPLLAYKIIEEVENKPIFLDKPEFNSPEEIDVYFHNMIVEFHRNRIIDYLTDQNNIGKEVNAVIAGALTQRFGVIPEGKEGADLKESLRQFIINNNLAVSVDDFIIEDVNVHDEDDREELEEIQEYFDEGWGSFYVIEEEDVYGVKLHDIVEAFGVCVIKDRDMFGIDIRNLPETRIYKVIDYLTQFVDTQEKPNLDIDIDVEEAEENSLELVLLKTGNILQRTGIRINEGVSVHVLQSIMEGVEIKYA
jgi:DNA polymerase I-like protein with 3'-5' exonuclease and polymerase domains